MPDTGGEMVVPDTGCTVLTGAVVGAVFPPEAGAGVYTNWIGIWVGAVVPPGVVGAIRVFTKRQAASAH